MIEKMKFDMGGAGAVLGAALRRLVRARGAMASAVQGSWVTDRLLSPDTKLIAAVRNNDAALAEQAAEAAPASPQQPQTYRPPGVTMATATQVAELEKENSGKEKQLEDSLG